MDEDSENLDELLAASMDAEPELLSLLPELFTDLEDLGARASDIVALLSPLNLDEQTRILDLGCGKGAAAIAIADTYGCTVRGVDGMADFVAHARAVAAEKALDTRCLFEVGDVRQEVRTASHYDVVMLLALGEIFGSLEGTLITLSPCIKAEGYIVLDDAFIADDANLPEDSYEYCYDYMTTRAVFEELGFEVVGEKRFDGKEDLDWLKDMSAKVLARAKEVASRYPEHQAPILTFAQRQVEETQTLTGPVIGATWVLKKRRI